MEQGALTVTIFGASGDLTARKLVPSVYSLDRKGRLPPEVRIVGVARSPFTDDSFRDKMTRAVREFAGAEWAEESWRSFSRRIHYVAADAAKLGGLAPLKSRLAELEAGKPGRRLFYLAVTPTLYADIAGQVAVMNEGVSSPGDLVAETGHREAVRP